MGTATSNVLQDCDEDDFMNMEYIRGGVVTSIPNEVKPRPRLGRNTKSTSKSNSKIKNESLRSALSVDLDNPEADRIRKEFEMFRLNKENELANFKRKEKKLETENRKLKTELQALQKTCKKLRDERDCAFDAEQRALMRAAAIETDRDKVQRQFKIYRETKESELQNLLKVRRDLESKIRKVDPSLLEYDINFQKDEDETWTPVNIGLHPKHQNDEPTELNHHHHHHRNHDNRWHGHEPRQEFDREEKLRNTSNVVSICWISCSDDDDDDDEMIQNTKDSLQKCCHHNDDHLLNFVKVKGRGEVVSTVTKYLSLTSMSIFSGIVFADISVSRPHHLKLFEEVMSFQYPINVFFCPSRDDNDDDDDDDNGDDDDDGCGGKNLVKEECNGGRSRSSKDLQRMMDTWQDLHSSATFSIHPSVEDVSHSLEKLIEKKLRGKHLEHRINCLNFMGWREVWSWQDWQDQLHHDINNKFNHHHHHQHQHRHHHHHHRHHHRHKECPLTESCFAFSWLDKYTNKMTAHVSSDGPIPPLLVEGVECSGKTTMIMRWIDQCRERLPSTFVLSYSVVDSSHPSSDPIILLKCLMFQIMQCFSMPFPLMLDPDQLVREFPRWLDKVSALFPGGVILVLDSIDRVKNFEVIFDWLMDPLPVDLKVVISLRSDACPPSWRSWPLLSIDSMTENEVREYVDLLLNDSSDKEVTLVHLLDNPSLCLPLPAYLTAVISTLSSEGVRILSPCRCLGDLYVNVLDVLEEMDGSCKESMRELLCLLVSCQRGLTLSELMELVQRSECDSSKVMTLVELMVESRLLRNYGGVIVLENDQVRSCMENWCHEESGVSMAMQKLKNYYSSRSCIEKLAFISWKLEDWPTLKSIVGGLESCLVFLRRGMGSELVKYWRSLNYDLSVVVQKLHLKLEEYEMNQEDSVDYQCSVAIGYELVGRFLADQGFHEEALDILQKCIEFHEHDVVFGQLKIGRVSNLLGHVHDKLGRRNMAETLYLAALTHFESATNPQKQSDINNNGNDNDPGCHDDDDIGRDDDDDGGHDDDVEGRDSEIVTMKGVDGTESCDDEEDGGGHDDDDDGGGGHDDDEEVRPKYRYHHLVAAQLELLASLHLKQGKVEMSDNFLKRAANLRTKMNDRRQKNDLKVNVDFIEQKILELAASRNSCLGDDLISAGFEHELGVLHALIGRCKEAETFLIGSLVKRESLLPSNHASIVQSLNSLVALYGKSKQVGKVDELSERLLEVVETEEEGSDVAIGCLRNLVRAHQSIGRLDKTEVYLEMLLNSMEQNPSTSSKELASQSANLAVVMSQQGKHHKADPLYGRALAIFASFLPSNHPSIIETMKNLAISKYEQGDFEEAAKLYLHTIERNQPV